MLNNIVNVSGINRRNEQEIKIQQRVVLIIQSFMKSYKRENVILYFIGLFERQNGKGKIKFWWKKKSESYI